MDVAKLIQWGERYELRKEWIDRRSRYPHFDLFAERQRQVLQAEGLEGQLARFSI